MAAPEWCTKYVSGRSLAVVQSTYAVLKIETSLVDVYIISANVGFEDPRIGDNSLSGILGEAARPVLDDTGARM